MIRKIDDPEVIAIAQALLDATMDPATIGIETLPHHHYHQRAREFLAMLDAALVVRAVHRALETPSEPFSIVLASEALPMPARSEALQRIDAFLSTAMCITCGERGGLRRGEDHETLPDGNWSGWLDCMKCRVSLLCLVKPESAGEPAGESA